MDASKGEPKENSDELDVVRLIAEFDTTAALYRAAERVRDAGYSRWDCITPFPVHGLDNAMGLKRSIVPRFSLAGGITGFCTGMAMIWYMDAFDYRLIVGGKPWAAWIPFCVVGFEGTILVGTLVNFTGLWIHTRLGRGKLPRGYDRRFSADKFAIIVGCAPERTAEVRALLSDWNATEFAVFAAQGSRAYWMAFDAPTHARQARLVRAAERDGQALAIETRGDEQRDATEVTIHTADHPGLFAALAGVSVVLLLRMSSARCVWK